MKIDLNTILIIAGFAILILFSQSDNSNNDILNKIDYLESKIDSLDFSILKDSIKQTKHEINYFTFDYINERDSLRSIYNPK